ncbi:MAG: BMP family ABC transporter substrate-binding protein [Acidimicrobiia bacterium]|nr:BMP family ABC transporter substrate-binding protein [Acidimicrobiia bacterium]
MDEQSGAPVADNGDDVARLVALTERQHDLWALLRDAQDEQTRNRLFDELSTNREELAQLKEKVSSEVDAPRTRPQNARPEPSPESPRSVGEELRSRILTPDAVAPASPPPPPPPPPLVIDTSEVVDASPIEPQEVSERAVEAVGTVPAATPREAPPAAPPAEEPETELPIGSLAPEKTPFSSREADLAATRPRHAEAQPRPPQPVPPSEAPAQQSPAAEPAAPPAAPAPPSRLTVKEQERRDAAHAALQDLEKVRPKHVRSFPIFAVLVAIIAVAAVAWMLFFWRNDNPAPSGQDVATTTTSATVSEVSPTATIRSVLDGLGLSMVAIEERSGTLFLTGVVTSDRDRTAAIGATEALAEGAPVDSTGLTVTVTDDEVRVAVLAAIADAGYDKVNVSVSGGVATLTGVTPDAGAEGLVAAVVAVIGIDQVVDLTEEADRAVALDAELQRITAVTPLVFASGQTDLNALQERILDSVAEAIQAYPGPLVTAVGYTDSSGSESGNLQVSLIRAENVRDYLLVQGIPAERLLVDARGESTSSGSEAVAGLERRVEFEVGYSVAATSGAQFRIGIVAPSARDDLAFTQSIVDAVNVIAAEQEGVEVDITDNTFVTDEAAAAIRSYAAGGYDLVIAHGSQYGTSLFEIANEYPDIAFAWGTAADTFGLPNVSSYEVAADEGGYVMGVISALLSDSGVIGVVGPLEVGDAQLFVDGFRNGVLATDGTAQVPVTYTGSFSDVAFAAEAARAHIDAGADVLTGSAQMVVGAVGVAAENDALWFGTQSDQAELAPSLVVASQVYHWEVVLRQIIAGIDSGSLGGETYTIDLSNGGIIIEYNDGYGLPDPVRDNAADTIAGIITGTITTGV